MRSLSGNTLTRKLLLTNEAALTPRSSLLARWTGQKGVRGAYAGIACGKG